MSVAVKAFGSYQGRPVEQFSLVSASGVEVDIISWGVVVRDWRVPVAGGMRSVVLGFEQFDSYPKASPYFGAIAGRVANRIKNGTFTLDGQSFSLAKNFGEHTLHGGPQGLGTQVWSGEVDSANNAVRFTLDSPDGAMGFPGNVRFTATYTLTGNTLRLDIAAKADRRTPINVVLNTDRKFADPVAVVTGPDKALTLKLYTDQPGLQIYNSVTTDASAEGKQFGHHCGFCLEDQGLPDSVNNPHFPSTIYGPDRDYSHRVDIEIA